MSTPGSIVHVVLTQWRSDAPSEALAEMREIIHRFSVEIGEWTERLVGFDQSA